ILDYSSLANPLRPVVRRFSIESGCGATSMQVKNRDVVIAGSHYDSVYAAHAGRLFSYKILHNGSRQSWTLFYQASQIAALSLSEFFILSCNCDRSLTIDRAARRH